MKNNFLTLTFLLILTSCKFGGTDTGNPVVDDNHGQCGKVITKNSKSDYSTMCVLPPITSEQAFMIAEKLSQCFPVTAESAYYKIHAQPGLSPEILVEADTYTELHRLYQDRLVNVDSDAFKTCISSIKEANCSSGLIQNTLTIQDDVADYSNVHSILQASPSCKIIYSYK